MSFLPRGFFPLRAIAAPADERTAPSDLPDLALRQAFCSPKSTNLPAFAHVMAFIVSPF